MSLSSNSLIHITNSIEKLKSIITEGFRIKYCQEDILFRDASSIGIYVPMVSFCDIPLSEIKRHISLYGLGVDEKGKETNVAYGIGLKKSWAEKKGLNPVLYVDKQSSLGVNFSGACNRLLQNKKIKELSEEELGINDIFRYMKNYEADLIRSNQEQLYNYRFSDEREWRYVPSIGQADFIHPSTLINSLGMKDEMNKKIEHLRLGFDIIDIKYLILSNDNEIHDFSKWLGEFFIGRDEDILKLQSRIITVDQILNDF